MFTKARRPWSLCFIWALNNKPHGQSTMLDHRDVTKVRNSEWGFGELLVRPNIVWRPANVQVTSVEVRFFRTTRVNASSGYRLQNRYESMIWGLMWKLWMWCSNQSLWCRFNRESCICKCSVRRHQILFCTHYKPDCCNRAGVIKFKIQRHSSSLIEMQMSFVFP